VLSYRAREDFLPETGMYGAADLSFTEELEQLRFKGSNPESRPDQI